jgi:acetyl esterase/lipase
VHDAADFLALVCSGEDELQKMIGERVDVSRVAVGGVSAGGQLAAVACLKVAGADTGPRMATKPKLQMLFVPVIDSTAAVDGLWKTARHSPWLTPERMMW